MKSLIFIAPPAGGKGTLSSMVREKYGIPHISTGDILREASQADTERGHYIKDEMAAGHFVSDDIILELLKERLNNDDCDNGYILDGFPRNISQALSYEQILNDLNKNLGYVIVLDIDKEVAKARVTSRVTCPMCNKIYSTTYDAMKPKRDNTCDMCNVALVHRADDNGDVYEERYNSYVSKTQPLIDYYSQKGVLFHVNGMVSKDETLKELDNILAGA